MIPVVVLTGFLGSGKTTLLNRWLAQGGGRAPGGGRLALVVNELGTVGIDGELLPSGSTRQVELPGGCVCCQLDEDLVRTIEDLTAGERDLELIVIETTGVADPLPIGWSLARPPLDRVVRLAAVVTVVDATLHPRNRALSPAVDAQVEGADLLVLGKLDLASEDEQRVVRAQLGACNPDSPILDGSVADNAAALWSLLADPPLGGGRVMRPATRPHAHPSDGPHAHAAAHGFETIALPIDGILDFEELSAALEELPPNVVRLKGLARVIDRTTGSDEEREVAFHRVGARVSCEPLAAAPSSGHRMVAIGRQLDHGQLAACLRAAMVR